MPCSVSAMVKLVGWHSWPAADGMRGYLADLHRHTFWVAVEVAVSHHDREVEFHDLADDIAAWWGPQTIQQDRGSCERMACELAAYLVELGHEPILTRVGEDGDFWATWRPDVDDQ